jgi:hypothetical protein
MGRRHWPRMPAGLAKDLILRKARPLIGWDQAGIA